MLNFRRIERGSELTVVLLHGFMGSSETFSHVELPFNMIIIDLPGHGLSSDEGACWSFDYVAAAIHDVIADEHVYLYGYSMGGRLGLYYALNYHVDGLILESASPGLQQQAERTARIAVDQQRAEEIKADYHGFVDRWERLPLFQTKIPLPDDRRQEQRRIRLSHSPSGLAKALTDYGTGRQPDLWPLLDELRCPVLLLAGTLDDKFKALNMRMAELIPDARYVEIEAGHTIHVEHPDIFDTIVVEFIKEAHHVQSMGNSQRI